MYYLGRIMPEWLKKVVAKLPSKTVKEDAKPYS